MPGTYSVDFSDTTKPHITIPPLSYNYSTSLKMVGYRTPVYGELIWENMLHLMEHFASGTTPINPVAGQIWYDTLLQELKLYDSTNIWQVIWPIPVKEEVIVSPTQPVSEPGLLWLNPVTNQLRINDGNQVWQLIWPIAETSTAVSAQTSRGSVPVIVSAGSVQNTQLNNPSTTRSLKVVATAEYLVDYDQTNPAPADYHFYYDLNTVGFAYPNALFTQYHDQEDYGAGRSTFTRIIDIPPGGSAYFSSRATHEAGRAAIATFYQHTLFGVTI